MFKLYKSAEVHTKQKRKIPGLVWFILIGMIGVAYFAPTFMKRMNDRVGAHPEAAAAKGSTAGAVDAAALGKAPAGPVVPGGPAPSPAGAAAGAPVFAGCARSKARCTCFDSELKQVEKPVEWCEHQTFADRPAQTALAAFVVPEQERHAKALASVDDYSVMAWMGRRAQQDRIAPAAANRSLTAKQ